jgi:hypothetical protein
MMTSQIHVPAEIELAMQMGAALSVSISGGKDSQAMARALRRQILWKEEARVKASDKYKTWPGIRPRRVDAWRFKERWLRLFRNPRQRRRSRALMRQLVHDYCVAKRAPTEL